MIKKLGPFSMFAVSVALMIAAPVGALAAGCDGALIEGWVDSESTFLRAREKSADKQRVNGYLNGQSARVDVERLNRSMTRLRGWLGSEPVSLKVQVKNNGETRLAGRLGGGEPVSVTIQDVAGRNQVRVHGFGRRGFVHMTFFRGGRDRFNGRIDRDVLTSELRRHAGGISMRGYLDRRFVDLEASNCLEGFMAVSQLSTAELLLVLAMLTA